METTPLVFIIDIDGCLLGDITPQIMLYEMILELKEHHVKINFNTKEFQKKLGNGIVRPYFKMFYNNIKKNIPNAEFFIYTASQKNWAYFLIANIEKSLKISFNRPLFTRDNCVIMQNNMNKSLDIIKPMIYKSLKKKYGANINLDNRIIMIDNTNVFNQKDNNSLLLCSTYNYSFLENIPLIITEDIYNRARIDINNILIKYINYEYEINNYKDFQKVFYTYYLSKLIKNSETELHDKFWYNLTKLIIIKKIKHFGEKVMTYLKTKFS
jgi:hypothetical protein